MARSSFKRCGDSPEEPEKTTTAAKASVIPRFPRGSEVETKRPWPAAALA